MAGNMVAEYRCSYGTSSFSALMIRAERRQDDYILMTFRFKVATHQREQFADWAVFAQASLREIHNLNRWLRRKESQPQDDFTSDHLDLKRLSIPINSDAQWFCQIDPDRTGMTILADVESDLPLYLWRVPCKRLHEVLNRAATQT